eukprot:gnl/MRDRNA2_/MRDRNA2_33135_c0_seq1.p1 gnl/MRDRNA2_/MRDRNA2_33135_c0~~gnl/MRDRNA2_/MRDRNA2_33135_c0_seq1.p1  ORF type:complete len:420 (-),score=132.39 gnl/MRDRNA2_/MRDRNA2_33135_c0_seq1:163-1422(-)
MSQEETSETTEPEVDEKLKALNGLTKKISQLTKVVFFLHTRNDVSEQRTVQTRSMYDEEIKGIASHAAGQIDRHKKQLDLWVDPACSREQISQLDRQHAQLKSSADFYLKELKNNIDEKESSVRQKLDVQYAECERQYCVMKERIQEKSKGLDEILLKAQGNMDWLERQLAEEFDEEKRKLEAEFKARCDGLKQTHQENIEAKRVLREKVIEDQKKAHEDRKQQLAQETESQNHSISISQEQDFAEERTGLEKRLGIAKDKVEEKRSVANEQKGQYDTQQQQLDEMTKAMNEMKNQTRLIQQATDKMYDAKQNAETEIRDLKRKLAQLEKTEGGGGGGGSDKPHTDRAIASLGDDVSSALARQKALQTQIDRARVLHREREQNVQAIEAERGRRAHELKQERARSDELQRRLLQLEANK